MQIKHHTLQDGTELIAFALLFAFGEATGRGDLSEEQASTIKFRIGELVDAMGSGNGVDWMNGKATIVAGDAGIPEDSEEWVPVEGDNITNPIPDEDTL